MTVWGKKKEYVYHADNVDESEFLYHKATVSRLDREEMIAYVEEKLADGWKLDGDSYYEDGFYMSPFEKTRLYCQKLKKKRIRGGMIRA